MKKNVKKIATIACAVLVSTAIPATISGNTDSGVFSTISASAASEVKQCYLIENANQTVYVSRNCSGTKVGTVYGTDLINVYEVHDDACYIGFPTSKGEKKGWIKTNLILLGTGGSTVKSKGRFTVYKRASTSSGSFGAVYTNDSTKIIGEKNNMVQLKYPTSNGYKYAWATKNDAQTYLGYGYKPPQNINMMMPIDGAYCSWRGYSKSTWSWSENSGASGSRVYHLGLDLKGSNKNIKAFMDGTVVVTGNNGANGNYVIIQHTISEKTVYSFYAHLSSISVSPRTKVSCGTKIGVIGNTGSASKGEHLHFAIANTLSSGGGYYGYATKFSGNKTSYSGITYYNPKYVIENKKLPA